MRRWLTVGVLVPMVWAGSVMRAQAGARLEISDEAYLELGLRIQALALASEKDLNSDGAYDSYEDFLVRRARIRLKGVVNQYVSGFLQTEGVDVNDETFGLDMRLIDAFITLKPNPWAQIVAGQNMAPASRQNLVSSGAMMCVDRPGMNTKTLTWGTRSTMRFVTSTYSDSDAGLRGEAAVRDVGATLFGSGSFTDTAHLKYYLGAYDGIQEGPTDSELRYTGRVQANIFDAEPSYYNASTYLGTRRTVGLGAAYDLQDAVAYAADVGDVDYRFFTLDAFGDYPVGSGSLTLEAGYLNLDLGDATEIDLDFDPETPGINASQSQGDGFYFQAGYYINRWQPWAELESWTADADSGKGSYDLYRLGLTYFIEGHHANVKAGVEQFEADAPIGSSTADSVTSFVLGVYLTY